MGDRGMVVSEAPASDRTLGGERASAAATCLRIAVIAEGRPVVQVTFPAFAIVNLSDLVPDEVRAGIAAHDLDLEDLAARYAAQGCPSGLLFSLPCQQTTVRAWME